MSIISDALGAAGTVEHAVAGAGQSLARTVTGTPAAAPVPPVAGGPAAAPAAPAAWSAPQAGGSGQVSVHRDVLTTVATGMRTDLQELDAAVSRLRSAGSGTLIAGWTTATGFSGNAANASSGVMQAGTQTGTAHQAASGNLAGSAAAYDAAESDNQQAVSSVGSQLNAMSGTVAAAGRG